MHKKICIKRNILFFGGFVGVIFIITIFLVKPIGQIKTSYKSKAAEPKSNSNIVGGTEITDPYKWPFMVRITVPVPLLLDTTFCDGSLITPQWVLTAGHCVTDLFDKVVPEKGIRVLNGSNDLSIGMKKFSVTKIFRHPNFIKLSNHYLNDIALIYLSEPLLGVGTLSLNSKSSIELDGKMSVIIGWGTTNYKKFPFLLNQAVIPILSNRRVNKKDWENGAVTDSEIAAGYPKGRVSACEGDSGGPLMVWNDSKWVQVGVVSWSNGNCGEAKHPVINTRISYSDSVQSSTIDYKQWIKDVIRLQTGETYSGEGTFNGKDLTQDEKKDFIQRIWLNCEMQHDDGQPC